jgi:lipoprotein-releasing system permease protein
MPFELHIALRYLLARRKQAFISVISLISTLGVAVGVAALIIALALMTGLQGELRDRILGAGAHVYVWKRDGLGLDYRKEVAKLRALDGVVGAAPAILGKALVRTERGDAFVTLKGIDPALEPEVTDLGRSMTSGRVSDLEPRSEEDVPGILVGVDLARELGVSVSDSVTLLTPEGTLSPMGMMPRARRLRVAGIYRLGIFELDAASGFVTLQMAERLLNTAPALVELKVRDMYDAPAIAERLAATLGREYSTQDWSDMNQSFFSALWLEKMAISITIGLIVIVAALNIIASLVLLVMEKSRDIAILKTMGATRRSVTVVFMLQGLVIGLVGTLAGSALGVGLCFIADRYKLVQIPADVYQISHVPFVVEPWDFVVVVVSAIFICFLATIYPSRQAARLDPVQALRFE